MHYKGHHNCLISHLVFRKFTGPPLSFFCQASSAEESGASACLMEEDIFQKRNELVARIEASSLHNLINQGDAMGKEKIMISTKHKLHSNFFQYLFCDQFVLAKNKTMNLKH